MLLARGESNRWVAEAFKIGPDTAKHHVRSLFEKSNVEDRVQAAAGAAKLGLLEEK